MFVFFDIVLTNFLTLCSKAASCLLYFLSLMQLWLFADTCVPPWCSSCSGAWSLTSRCSLNTAKFLSRWASLCNTDRFLLLNQAPHTLMDKVQWPHPSPNLLQLLINHYEQNWKYYCLPSGMGSFGTASEEELLLTKKLFWGIFDSLSHKVEAESTACWGCGDLPRVHERRPVCPSVTSVLTTSFFVCIETKKLVVNFTMQNIMDWRLSPKVLTHQEEGHAKVWVVLRWRKT